MVEHQLHGSQAEDWQKNHRWLLAPGERRLEEVPREAVHVAKISLLIRVILHLFREFPVWRRRWWFGIGTLPIVRASASGLVRCLRLLLIDFHTTAFGVVATGSIVSSLLTCCAFNSSLTARLFASVSCSISSSFSSSRNSVFSHAPIQPQLDFHAVAENRPENGCRAHRFSGRLVTSLFLAASDGSVTTTGQHQPL